MKFSTLFLIFFCAILIFSAYLIMNLNSEIVLVDFLFYEVQVGLGLILLIFFLLGFLIALFLELINFYRIKNNKNE